MTPMDSLYNGCYIVNLLLFVLFIFDIILLNEAPESKKEETIEKIKMMDRWIQILCVFLLIAVSGIATLDTFFS